MLSIGTYFDWGGKEGLQSRESKLRDIIQSSKFFQKDGVKIFTCDGKTSLLFPLNNIASTVTGVKELWELVVSIIEQAFDPISLPMPRVFSSCTS